jgi:succinate dehydrogenase/fumarate reductase-like Fe-S protein
MKEMEETKEKIAKVKVYRFDPLEDKEPHYQTYEVPLKYENMTVLGLLMYIYENLDPSIGFMYSCCRLSEQGRCGVCDMVIDGKGAQACTAPAKEGETLVEPPLKIGFPVIRDLIPSQYSLADRDRFFLSRATAAHRFRKAYEKTRTKEE